LDDPILTIFHRFDNPWPFNVVKMGSLSIPKLRIGCGSGGCTDRRPAFLNIAKNEGVHFIVGDWLSEYNMTTRGGSKINNKGISEEFEPTFLEAIEPALPYLQQNKIKVAANAGASDPKKLHDILVKLIESKGLDLKVAWIEGDEVIDAVQKARTGGNDFTSLTTGASSALLWQVELFVLTMT
jgi:hypothetical protein